jgi:thioredoxin 1
MKEVSDLNFNELVINNKAPSVVDFWAPWCGPCQTLTPILTALENDYSGLISFFKMDVDNNPDTPQEYSIRSVPTILIFKNGGIVECIIGVQSKQKLKSIIGKYLLH